jgi:hypothetical protein
MNTEAAITLLTQILRQWARDAAACDQERRALAGFLELPEERVSSLVITRCFPAGRPAARKPTSRRTHATRTPTQ